jgi:hypothetical protein
VRSLNGPQRKVIVVALGVVLWAAGNLVIDDWWGSGPGLSPIIVSSQHIVTYHGSYQPITGTTGTGLINPAEPMTPITWAVLAMIWLGASLVILRTSRHDSPPALEDAP